MHVIRKIAFVAYWLLFIAIIVGGATGIYIGLTNLGIYPKSTIIGLMAAYSTACIMLMCLCTCICASCNWIDKNNEADGTTNETNNIEDNTCVN